MCIFYTIFDRVLQLFVYTKWQSNMNNYLFNCPPISIVCLESIVLHVADTILILILIFILNKYLFSLRLSHPCMQAYLRDARLHIME